MPDFLPRRDGDFLAWSANFDRQINQSPELYGLSVELAEDYRTRHLAFAEAYQRTKQANERTPTSIVEKDQARAEVTKLARQYAKLVAGKGEATSADRINLGLRTRKKWTRVAPPADAPHLFVKPVLEQNAVEVRIFDPASPTRTAKPKGTDAAVLYTFVGEDPPDNIHHWQFRGPVTRTRTKLTFPSTVGPGERVWVAAYWQSPTGCPGPFSRPASARNSGGFAKADGVRAA